MDLTAEKREVFVITDPGKAGRDLAASMNAAAGKVVAVVEQRTGPRYTDDVGIHGSGTAP